MHRRMSIAAIVVGAVCQLAGLSVDALLHARDSSLAEREGVLSLTNPGHLLFAGGLTLVVLGASALLLVQRSGGSPRGARARLVAAIPSAFVLLLAGGAFAITASTGGLNGHEHVEAVAVVGGGAPGHTHEDALAAAGAPQGHPGEHVAASTPTVNRDTTNHSHGSEVPVSWEQLQAANSILATARDATAKYQDVAVARADGYVQVTQVVPGLGAHFVNAPLLASGRFDPEHPSILLYDQRADGSWEFVGVSWTSPKRFGNDTPPESAFGPLATWHYHTGLCFGARAGSPIVSASDATACRSAGGVWSRETPWMVHAWIFRASPEGVFSHENSTIAGTRALAGTR